MRAGLVVAIQTGLFVLLGLTALGFLTMQLPTRHLELFGSGGGYRITAQFDDIGDLKVGDPVAMAGVRVGRVERIALDHGDYRALVTMRIGARYNRIPRDSEASIDTVGLLGGQYIAIGPGPATAPGWPEGYLGDGGRLTSTHSAFVLENVVNRLFSVLARKSGGEPTPP
jgi:phospholipid/cholesterol/gamma-HCH transport system substrate-binding protein